LIAKDREQQRGSLSGMERICRSTKNILYVVGIREIDQRRLTDRADREHFSVSIAAMFE
jgi:hypothetical protein